MADTAKGALHEILLQALLRAERIKADRKADEIASAIARRMDKREEAK